MALCTRLATCLLVIAAVLDLSLSNDICDPMGGTNDENFLKVSETAEIGYVIFNVTVHGEDRDVDLRGSYNEYFAFNRTTRQLFVNASLDSDIEALGLQRISVDCTDRTIDRKVTISFIITLKDENDNAPIFTQDVYRMTVGEMTKVASQIDTQVIAQDIDASTAYSIVYYSIVPGEFSDYFFIENTLTVKLTLLKPLDYETVKEINITIMAKDFLSTNPNANGFNTTCQLVITIEDEDDQYPVFNSSIYKAVIGNSDTRNSPLRVTPPIGAYDPDLTLNARVEYSFHDAGSQSNSLFNIDALTGDITLLQRPSTEDVYLLVQATQVDNPSRYGVALLTVHVQGSNVNPPLFTRTSYHVTRTESFPVGSVVVMVMATDKEGSAVRYSLQVPSDTFSVDTNSGDVTLLKPLSYENQPTYTFNVLASDGELTQSAEVKIQLVPSDNQPPRILTSNLNVTAIKKRGVVVADVDAEDPDQGDVISYRLVNHIEHFSIDVDGRITVTSEDKSLIQDEYQLVVVVSDGKQPSYQRVGRVTVRFPAVQPPPVGAATASTEDMVPVVLGALAGVFFILIIILIVYIVRTRFRDKEHLDRAKRQQPNEDPKALKFKQKNNKSLGRKLASKSASKIDRIEYREHDETDGDTTIQENPLTSPTKGSYFNFGQVHSDTDTEIDPSEIQIETSVAPYDIHHTNDDNNNTDNIYNNSQMSVESEDYNSLDKNVLNQLYRNGSLSTYRESSGSELSLNASPTDSADSKKILVPGGSSSREAPPRIPEESIGFWEANGGSNIPSMDLDEPIEEPNPTEPLPQKSELTVYF